MKALKTLLITTLFAALSSVPALSQSFDANRMDRDLKIMESILGELFKTQVQSSNRLAPRVRALESTYFTWNSSSRIKGTFVPDFGAIFMIPNQSQNRIVIQRVKNDTSNVTFQYSAGENNKDRSIDKESVVARISEFLQNYASTIGQLKEEDRVLVIYGAQDTDNRRSIAYTLNNFVTGADDRDEEVEPKEPLPVITVSATKKDLDNYRSGALSSEAFKKQLQVSASEKTEKLDLKVLGNIFKTGLGEGDGEQFHLINNSSLSYLYLDNFGALYTLDLHRGHGLSGIRSIGFTTTNNSGDEEVEEQRIEIQKLRGELAEKQKKTTETLKAEYQKLVQRTKEFIIDYGRTLSSLKPDQFLLVSLNITDAVEGIPQRVDFQIKKSTLANMDRGSLSREDAIKAVTMTEY